MPAMQRVQFHQTLNGPEGRTAVLRISESLRSQGVQIKKIAPLDDLSQDDKSQAVDFEAEVFDEVLRQLRREVREGVRMDVVN